MKKGLFLLAILLNIVGLSCCKKEILFELPTELDQMTKEYTIFQKNSHWIYRSEKFNYYDSCAITRSEVWVHGGNPDKYITQEMDFYSSHYNKKFFQRSEAYHMSEDNGFSIHILWAQDARTSAKCTFFSNRAVGSTYDYWYYPNLVTYQEFLPIYTLDGKVYTDVMAFESRYTGASIPFDDPRLPIRVWYAKHVGIIRKEMSNGDFWNLVSYDVKQ